MMTQLATEQIIEQIVNYSEHDNESTKFVEENLGYNDDLIRGIIEYIQNNPDADDYYLTTSPEWAQDVFCCSERELLDLAEFYYTENQKFSDDASNLKEMKSAVLEDNAEIPWNLVQLIKSLI